MSKSLTYYLTIWVIRIKGIKKVFSQYPIDFKALRKDDIHEPKGKFWSKAKTDQFTVKQTRITATKNGNTTGKLVVYIHGGAFVSGPAQHHWDSLERMAKETAFCFWMSDYPKAPEHKIDVISDNIDTLYDLACKQFGAENIILMGDSAGGTLVIALTQRLIQKNKALPHKIFLLSPVVDASFENPEIDLVDKIDPMLSKNGARSAKEMAAIDGNLKNERLSPIYGNFDGFPSTYLFVGENDITYPDQKILCKKLAQAEVKHKVVLGKEMPHIWPLLPVMNEAKTALSEIIELLKE